MANTTGQVMPDGSVQYYEDAMGRAMISSEYDPTSSYAVGDYCMYNDVRYICNTAIASGGETWNSAHWDVAKVDDDVTEIKQSLSQLHMGTMTKTFTNGYCEIATSDFGMSIKPTALVMTPCNQIIVMRYDYDGSSNSIVKVYVGNNYSGLLRFCYWAK